MASAKPLIGNLGFLSAKLILFLLSIFLGYFLFEIDNVGFYYSLVFLFAHTLMWLIFDYKKHKIKNQQLYQILIDIFLENILIHFSGGLDSPYIFLLIFDLCLAGYFLKKQQLYLLIFYIAISYTAFSTLGYLDLLPKMISNRYSFKISPGVYFYYVVYMRIFIFFMIGYLVSQLASRLFFQRNMIEQIQDLNTRILAQMRSGMVTVDEEDRILYANEACEGIFGCSGSELLGKKWHSFIRAERAISEKEFVDKANTEDGIESVLVKSGGQKIHVSISISYIGDEFGRGSAKTIVFRDLSEVKENERLQQEQERLSTLSELSGTLAHEIKNPLASICGSLEVLNENKAFEDGNSQKLVNVIYKESERLTRILNDFVTYSGERDLNKGIFNIVEIVDDFLLMVQHNPQIKPKINLIKDFDVPEEIFAWFDQDSLKQVILNLVLNANQAIEEEGEIKVSLRMNEDPAGELIEVSVSDNGSGMDEDTQQKIFQPFFTTQKSGMGLGLNVFKKLCKKHSWKYSVSSTLGEGTVFTVTIPVVDPDDLPRQPE